ncbi:MAG: hypothetical protein ABFS16_16285 [Bacteroidota bacterium]
MKLLNFLRDFIIIFVIVFVVSAVVSFVYSSIAYGTGSVDWESAIRFSIIFGIILPVLKLIENRR